MPQRFWFEIFFFSIIVQLGKTVVMWENAMTVQVDFVEEFSFSSVGVPDTESLISYQQSRKNLILI